MLHGGTRFALQPQLENVEPKQQLEIQRAVLVLPPIGQCLVFLHNRALPQQPLVLGAVLSKIVDSIHSLAKQVRVLGVQQMHQGRHNIVLFHKNAAVARHPVVLGPAENGNRIRRIALNPRLRGMHQDKSHKIQNMVLSRIRLDRPVVGTQNNQQIERMVHKIPPRMVQRRNIPGKVKRRRITQPSTKPATTRTLATISSRIAIIVIIQQPRLMRLIKRKIEKVPRNMPNPRVHLQHLGRGQPAASTAKHTSSRSAQRTARRRHHVRAAHRIAIMVASNTIVAAAEPAVASASSTSSHSAAHTATARIAHHTSSRLAAAHRRRRTQGRSGALPRHLGRLWCAAVGAS
eukprot:comp21449_c0_seq1/m.46560 comp21449_c0_seq1/g.46560  ORF comp21449_c0_seq1/g.46560 comp21449_c0_seq1/m.46560 type:complete len:347 (+) comp21449_c0_seq1:400-1440(+)